MSFNMRSPALENNVEQKLANIDLTNIAKQVEQKTGNQLKEFSNNDKTSIKAALIKTTCGLGDGKSTIDFVDYNKDKGVIDLRVDGCFDRRLNIKEILTERDAQLTKPDNNPFPVFKHTLDLGGIREQIGRGTGGLLKDFSPEQQQALKEALTRGLF